MTEHRALAIGYFNATWDLIDLPTRTAIQDRDMLSSAFASRQHWIDAGGTDEQLITADWQVAHVASLAGLGDLALRFAEAAADRASNSETPDWLVASTHEGLARAYSTLGAVDAYTREATFTRSLLEQVDDDDDRELIASQLASIPVPT